MREQQAELDALGVQTFAVTFESAARVRHYREHERVAYPILRDPRREAYRTYGIQRKPLRALGSLATGRYYLREARRGHLPRLTRSDYVQLGGDVLLDPRGEPCWVYTSREPSDRPSVEQIVRAARGCLRD